MIRLTPYWVRFVEAPSVCIEAQTIEGVYPQAAAHGKVTTVKVLPYPAEPRVSVARSMMPCFCVDPDKCQGRTSCPRKVSCTE